MNFFCPIYDGFLGLGGKDPIYASVLFYWLSWDNRETIFSEGFVWSELPSERLSKMGMSDRTSRWKMMNRMVEAGFETLVIEDSERQKKTFYRYAGKADPRCQSPCETPLPSELHPRSQRGHTPVVTQATGIYTKEEIKEERKKTGGKPPAAEQSSSAFSLTGEPPKAERGGFPADRILSIAKARGVRSRLDVVKRGTGAWKNLKKLWDACDHSLSKVEDFFEKVKASQYLTGTGAFEGFDEHKKFSTLSWLIDAGPNGDWVRMEAVMNGEFDDSRKLKGGSGNTGTLYGWHPTGDGGRGQYVRARALDVARSGETVSPNHKWVMDSLEQNHHGWYEPLKMATSEFGDVEVFGCWHELAELDYKIGDKVK